MSRSRRRGGRRGQQPAAANHERWLLTYADMITLLMALFIVMFSVSVVDQKKLDIVSRSFQQAFNGKVLTGGGSIREEPSGEGGPKQPVEQIAAIAPILPDLTQGDKRRVEERAAAAGREEQELIELKRRIDEAIRERGLKARVEATVERRGLVIRVVTDDVLFASGSAALQPGGRELLGGIARVLKVDTRHPIAVDGHTDNVPISTSRFPDNLELSASRATSVTRFLIGRSLAARRFAATGHGAQQPRASNDSETGRRTNRRVEIALTRLETPVSPSPTVGP